MRKVVRLMSCLAVLSWAQTLMAATLVSIAVTPANTYLSAGNVLQFTAMGKYSDGTIRDITSSVTWTSSVVGVAPISGTGLASANGGGVTSISANSGPVTGSTTLNVRIASSFFGLSVNQLTTDPWPTTVGIPFATFRTLGSSIKWADIETCDPSMAINPMSCYDWTKLDNWLARLRPGQDVLFTLFATPTWASSKPSDTSCAFLSQNGPGICDPPKGLAADGTGDDHLWTDFITALYNHVAIKYGPNTIKYWEVWNEPNVPSEWKPTDLMNYPQAQLLTMARDAYNVIKTQSALYNAPAFVTTPAVTDATTAVTQGHWLWNYLEAGGGAYADIIAVHGYIDTGRCATGHCPIAENVSALIENTRYTMMMKGQQTKPLQVTEGSWDCEKVGSACVSTITDPDLQAAFTAKYYAIQASKAVAKFAWYGFDFPEAGNFWNATPPPGQLNSAGVAYQQIHQWLVGAVPTAACSPSGTVWTCDYKLPPNLERLVWDSSCTDVMCQTSYSVPPGYTSCTNLDGTACAITAGVTWIGLKPILLATMVPNN
jgi:hypothetical protein